MIRKLINKIRQFEYRILTSHQLQEDHLALNQLMRMFPDQIFLPLTSWSISPREVLHICNDIVINKRKNIVEFGSGFSTICIAQLLKINNNKASFISVENNESWATELNILLENLQLQDYVNIITAPIADVSPAFAKAQQKKWYDVSKIERHLSETGFVDLVIVDGPFGGTTPFARYSAIPFLQSKLSDNYAVFLDDTSRDEERQIATDWHKALGGKLKDHKRYICMTSASGFDVSPYGIRYKL